MKGKLVLIIGPSGSGKSTIIQSFRDRHPEIIFPISCTTREKRPGEREGENYYFLTTQEFEHKINTDNFLEYASYGGNLYGTLKSEIMDALAEGKILVREVEVQGARLIMERVPKENLVIVFIDAGSWESLAERIERRAPMSKDEFELRKQRYEDEILFKGKADYIIENKGDVQDSVERLEQVISDLK